MLTAQPPSRMRTGDHAASDRNGGRRCITQGRLEICCTTTRIRAAGEMSCASWACLSCLRSSPASPISSAPPPATRSVTSSRRSKRCKVSGRPRRTASRSRRAWMIRTNSPRTSKPCNDILTITTGLPTPSRSSTCCRTIRRNASSGCCTATSSAPSSTACVWRPIISTHRPRSCSARSTRPWRTISASMRRNGCCRWTIRRR